MSMAVRARLTRLGLTEREAEVVLLVVEGKTDAEIAAILFLSRRTVEKHLEHAYSKLGVKSRTAASAVAFRALALTSIPGLSSLPEKSDGRHPGSPGTQPDAQASADSNSDRSRFRWLVSLGVGLRAGLWPLTAAACTVLAVAAGVLFFRLGGEP